MRYWLSRFWIATVAISQMVSCIDEIDPQVVEDDIGIDLKNALVVDARIDDRNERQSVYLSRTFNFDEENPMFEENALVALMDEEGTKYYFFEEEPGHYRTESAINLNATDIYTLEIVTEDGQKYISSGEQLPSKNRINQVVGKRKTNDSGKEGVSIVVMNEATNNTASFFRFEYDETYKIVAPNYNPFEWGEIDYTFADGDGWEVLLKPREEDVRVCFATETNRDLNLATTESLISEDLENYEIRFLEKDDFKISHRYSILVKQFHHSRDAYSFFSSLEDFSGFENVFSNVQTGFLQGNMRAVDSDKPVLGYFELSSYSEIRYFFNYEDFFPNSSKPDYIISCEFVGKPPLYPEGFHTTEIDGEIVVDGTSNSPLIDGILANSIAYIGDNENYLELDEDGNRDGAPFLVLPTGCVDCTAFGSTVTPEFWIEE